MELLQGLLTEPNPCSGRELQNSEETILFLRVQHAESLLALISSCFSMERFPVPCQLPFHDSQKYSCVSWRPFQWKEALCCQGSVPTPFAWENWSWVLLQVRYPWGALFLSCPRLLSAFFSVPSSALQGLQAPVQICQWVFLLHSELPGFSCPLLIIDGLTVFEVWVINPDLRQYLNNENKPEN